MPKTLGIFVSSNNHLDKIIELCKAAKKKGVEIVIFFSHLGVLSTQDSRFSELDGLAKLSVCKVGVENHGLKTPIPGIRQEDYGTQALHGEIIEECDRYLVF